MTFRAFICKFKQLVLMRATVSTVVVTVIHTGLWCGFHFQLDSLRFCVFEFQGYRHFFAFFQLFFQTHEHNVVAAWFQLGYAFCSQRHAAFNFAHTHNTVVVNMGVYFNAFCNRAAAAYQEVLFGFIVLDFHECATHFHTFDSARAQPSSIWIPAADTEVAKPARIRVAINFFMFCSLCLPNGWDI